MLNQPLFAALDVSLETTTICIMSFDGTITKRAEGNAGRALDARGPAEGHREQRSRTASRLRPSATKGLAGPLGGRCSRSNRRSPYLVQIFESLLMAREALREQLIILDKRVRDAARADRVCRRLMSAPGVGAIVAMTFRAAVDQP